jgi:hypothetical protein
MAQNHTRDREPSFFVDDDGAGRSLASTPENTPVTARETPAARCSSPAAPSVAGAATSANGFFQTPVDNGRWAPSSTSRGRRVVEARSGDRKPGEVAPVSFNEDGGAEEDDSEDDDTPMIARQRVQRTRSPDAPARATRSSGIAYFALQLMHV